MTQIISTTKNKRIEAPWCQYEYTLDTNELNELTKQLKGSVYFDSSDAGERGRYDIFSAEPLQRLREETEQTPKQELPSVLKSLPFVCGKIGFASYDFSHARSRRPQCIVDTKTIKSELPLLYIAYFTWSYVYDRAKQQGYLTFSPLCDDVTQSTILRLIDALQINSEINQSNEANTNPQLKSLAWYKGQTFNQYQKAFNTAMDYIHAGDCYQVNLSQQFEAISNCHAADLFFASRAGLNTPYSCYMSLGNHQHILSFSPEQFLSIVDAKVTSKPIKGTVENTLDPKDALELSNSLKNQAENLMIVDLLRNDLSRICELNSVTVPKLFELESYKNVHHLVSTINGKLKSKLTELDAFFSCFPGGSITGAPKKRAMEIIEELEPHRREAYCGSVFYWSDSGRFDSNILIRTVVKSHNKLLCWGGGGIVADSILEEEYLESITKVKNLTGIVR